MSIVATYQNDGVPLPEKGGARAAILLMTLGADGASRVLKHMTPDEIRRLSDSASGLGTIAPEAVDEIVEAFQDAFRKPQALTGPAQQMAELLQGALGSQEFQEVFGGLAGAFQPFEPIERDLWEEVSDLSGEVLAPKLRSEHPQVVAILLSRIPSKTAAMVVKDFDVAFRNSVLRRMLTVRTLSGPIRDLFEEHIRFAYLGSAETQSNENGHATLAEIVNRLGKQQSDEVLTDIERVTPRDAEKLRRLLFSFEDVVQLSQKARLTLFDVVATETTTLALRGAAGDLKESVLSALGQRARRMVEAELSQEASASDDDIDAARRQVAAEALRLARDGRIQMKDGGEK